MAASSRGERLTIWVDAWQQECCGVPWTIGSRVSWTLAEVGEDHRLESLFPADAAVVIDAREEHHGADADDNERTNGAVIAVRGVQVRHEPTLGGNDLQPVPGSATLTALTHSNGEELRWDGFVGYLVELDADVAAGTSEELP